MDIGGDKLAEEMSEKLRASIIPTLVRLLEHQYQVKITYEIKKPQADKTA